MSSRTLRAAAASAAAAIVTALAYAAPASADPFIYYGSNNGSGVWRAEIDGSSRTNIIMGGEFAPAMAVDREHIFFKSLGNAIYRADIDGSNVISNYIPVANPTSISEIEVNATHIFWTEGFTDTIGRARIAGTCTAGGPPPCDIEPSFIPGGAGGTGSGGVKGLAINGSHIYWTRVVAGAIGRANIDGTSRDTSFITGINSPQTQAPFDVDVNATHIYWSDGPDKQIGRAQLNGSGPPTSVESAYLSINPSDATNLEVNDTHVHWADDGGNIGRARISGTCSGGGSPPCDLNTSFISPGNQLRGLALGFVPVDVVVTDCDAPELAALTEVSGDLIIQNVPGCDAVSLPNLTEVGGDVVIDDNPGATTIDLGSLTTVIGGIVISDNPGATGIDIGSLTSVTGGIDITDNTAADAIDIGALSGTTGGIDISGNTGATTIDIGSVAETTGSINISENTGATTIDAAALTATTGSISIDGNTEADVIDVASLTTVSGSITITDNPEADAIDIGALSGTIGGIDISGNTGATTIDVASLTTVSGSVDISGNSSDTVVDASSLTSVSGSAAIDTAGTTVDLSGLGVGGDLTLTGNGSDSVSAATAGGVTDVSVLGGTAAMHVVLPDGAFALPVAFTIERQGDGPAEAGTTASGAAAEIDPVAGYRFTFDIPTLNQDAVLAFTVDLAQLDPATRAALLAGVGDGSATLAVRGDGQNALYQAISRCTGVQTPEDDACVRAVLLASNGQPAAPGTEPAFVRFDGVAGHFSTYAVALARPAAVAPPGGAGTAPPGGGPGPIPPGPGSSGGGPAQTVRSPDLQALGAKPRKFAAARSGASVLSSKKKAGTKVTYRLSKAATVRFTVERAKGRAKKLKGSFKHKGKQGMNTFRFSGRLRGRKLGAGRYTLVAVATDAAGRKSKPRRAEFRIAKP